MLHWNRLWLLSSLLSIAAGACSATATAAEFCSCSNKTFTWRGCRDDAHCDPGGWAGCAPSTDDGFAIRSGCNVTVDPGDDVLLSQPQFRSVRVESGGSLTIHGPVEWRIGPEGLIAAPGSSVAFEGCFRRYAGDGPDCSSSLGADDLFHAGLVIPCRDLDCSDDADTVRLLYPDNTAMLRSGLLERIDAARDVLCFWQKSEADYLGADSGYCYKITGVGDQAGAGLLDFDIRQVWRAKSDQYGYRLERKQVQQGTLAEVVTIGARQIRFNETDVVEGRTDQMGRWLRCNGDQRAYLISSVVDDPDGDAVVLADDRGITTPYSRDTRCHIDWGWTSGDIAFVMSPVLLSSQTNRENESYALLQGNVSMSAVVVDGLGGNGSGGRGALQIKGANLQRMEHVWMSDPLVHDREAILLEDMPCGTSVYHLTITGGLATAAGDKNYGLAWFGGVECVYELIHYYPRYRSDDDFVVESTGAAPIGGIHLQYVHAGPSSAPGDSGQLFDFGGPNPTNVVASDLLCVACTSQDGYGSLILPSAGSGLISGLLWVGVFNGALIANGSQANNPQFQFHQLGVVGSAVDANDPLGGGSLAGLVADSFYVRDVSDPRSASSQLCIGSSYGAPTRTLSHGIFANISLGALPCEASLELQLSDVYFLNVARVGATGSILDVLNGATNVRLQRLTMAFPSASQGITRGIGVSNAAAPHLTLDGPLLAGFNGPGVGSAMSVGSAANARAISWGAPTCFYGNRADDSLVSIAAYGTPPLRGGDPLFVDPGKLLFDLAADSPALAAGCGAGTAGFATADWAHR